MSEQDIPDLLLPSELQEQHDLLKTFVQRAHATLAISETVVQGWSLILQIEKQPSGARPHLELWRLAAVLVPFGRGSTEKDWQALGSIVQMVVDSSGYPPDLPMLEPVTPIETTHPNAPLHWHWYNDGSSCYCVVIEGAPV